MTTALADQLIEQGNHLEDRADFDGAIQLYLDALEKSPDYWYAYLNLGIVYNHKGELRTALDYLQKAYELQPDTFTTGYNLARTWYQLGQNHTQAVSLLQHALSFKPDYIDGWILLSMLQDEIQHTELALQSIDHALTIEPNHYGALLNKIHYLKTLAKSSEKYESQAYLLLKKLSPQNLAIHSLFVSFLRERGYVKQALELAQRQYEFENINQFSSYLMTLLYADDITPEQVLQEHQNINAFIIPEEYHLDINPNDKIHIGFLSPDLNAHAVAYFIEPILKHYNSDKFKISVYNISPKQDDVTKQLKQSPVQWFDVQDLSDEQIIAQIRADQVHILFDLAGHSSHNRLNILAQKPAPIITSWLGYLATTGLKTVDFRLVDSITDPVGQSETHHSEQLIRIDGYQWCYTPQDNTPAIQNQAYHQKGYITFGSFNQCAKLSDTCLHTWAKLLQQVPNSQFFFAGVEQGLARERIEDIFDEYNIDSERYHFQGRVSWTEYFNSYNQVDIALDSYPYTGATTTFDALIMGVPVITLAGKHSISRSAMSIVTALNHPEWIAQNPDDYIQRAIQLSEELKNNAESKHQLRQALLKSDLVNGEQFARHFESAVMKMIDIYRAS